MLPSAEREWVSGRVIQFVPRRTWESNRRLVDDFLIGNMEEDNNDVFYSLPSDTNDNDSTRSFSSILDENHHITTSLSMSNNRNERDISAPKCVTVAIHPAHDSTPKLSGQDTVLESYRPRLARRGVADFTIPSEMKREFLRTSRIVHQIRSEAEQRFHRYIDRLEAEMLRERLGVPLYASEEELKTEHDSVIDDEEQKQPQEGEHPTIPESTPVSSPSSSINTMTRPFNKLAALERQRKRRGEDFKSKSIESLHVTPERASSSLKSIWPSPSPARFPNGESGAWWVAVPAASESGEVWEEVDEVWRTSNKDRKDDISTFTACEEDIGDEIVDFKESLRCKRRWTRCKKACKRVLRWKR